ncbi:SipW-dependent-type signal peptide-containing protein [Nesterenkonia rhizosphaerae]|uniref:Uncharacterized protein n=1 Tax=Nesterenkonia rhizosphaerae TaxID=1348272 RepID=A0ABP9FWG3_9MICC
MGLVLGVGASSTLAAWNDSEYGQGTISSGVFITQTFDPAASGGTWRATDEGSPATMTYSAASGLTPGQHTYGVFSVRTSPDSVPGTLLFNGAAPNTSALHGALRYGVRIISDRNCTEGSFNGASGSTVVPNGSILSTPAASAQNAPTGGTTIHYCIRVTLPSGAPNSLQGQTTTPRFSVTGTSS